MPSNKSYDLVSDDGYDCRIPLHNEEAFEHGLVFHAKYIGSLDMPRPSNRVEIVSAMRRIRYEFKAKAAPKKKVILTVSVQGVKVIIRSKKRSSPCADENRVPVLHHPIHQIFYVSHDSQDLKIWSYIAREGTKNIFKCHVFKAYKKIQAMHLVRTIGQAFEVCHKLGSHCRSVNEGKEVGSDRSLDEKDEKSKESLGFHNTEGTDHHVSAGSEPVCTNTMDINMSVTREDGSRVVHKPDPPRDLHLNLLQTDLFAILPSVGTLDSGFGSSSSEEGHMPLGQHHHELLVRHQLEQQLHETQVTVAHVQLLKDQLSAETAARLEAQVTAEQLLLHNKDLLDHVTVLVRRIQQMEMKLTDTVTPITYPDTDFAQVLYPQDATVPISAYSPSSNSFTDNDKLGGASTSTNQNSAGLAADWPDSNHKAVSLDSLSYNLIGSDWLNPYNLQSFSTSWDPDPQNSSISFANHTTECLPSEETDPASKSTINNTFVTEHVQKHSQNSQNTEPNNPKLTSPLSSPSTSQTQRTEHKTPHLINYLHPLLSPSSLNIPTQKLDPPPKSARKNSPLIPDILISTDPLVL